MKSKLTAVAAIASAMTVCSLAGPDVASAVATRPHPPITDVAGDARNPLGANVAAADIRSADLTLRGRVLTATLRTGASAAGGSGPSNNYDHAPYALMGVLSNPNGQAVATRITLNPGGRGVVSFGDETFFEATTTSSRGLTRVSFRVPRNAISEFSQGLTARTAARGFAAFAEVATVVGPAADRTDNYDFTLGG